MAKQLSLTQKKQPQKLAEYTRLRKQAKSQGIIVPRGTSLTELKALLAGKKTAAEVKESVKQKRQAKAKPRRTRVPKGAKSLEWGWGW